MKSWFYNAFFLLKYLFCRPSWNGTLKEKVYCLKVRNSNFLRFDKHQSQFLFRQDDKHLAKIKLKNANVAKNFSFYHWTEDAAQYLWFLEGTINCISAQVLLEWDETDEWGKTTRENNWITFCRFCRNII